MTKLDDDGKQVIKRHDEPYYSILYGFINFDGILGRRTKKGRKQYLTIYQDEEKKRKFIL